MQLYYCRKMPIFGEGAFQYILSIALVIKQWWIQDLWKGGGGGAGIQIPENIPEKRPKITKIGKKKKRKSAEKKGGRGRFAPPPPPGSATVKQWLTDEVTMDVLQMDIQRYLNECMHLSVSKVSQWHFKHAFPLWCNDRHRHFCRIETRQCSAKSINLMRRRTFFA